MSVEVLDRTGRPVKEKVDIFQTPNKDYVIPKDAPVLASMASRGGVELVVKDDGSALVIFDQPQPERVHWIEYDVDLDMLTFVTWSGKVFGLGMKIHPPFKPHLERSRSIYMILMKDGTTPTEIDNVVTVVRNIGL